MITFWHNPRCSKSRAALKLLQEAGAELKVRRYLEDVPTPDELHDVLDLLGLSAIEIVRVKEPDFEAAGLSKDANPDDLITAMARDPKLIERPIAIHGDRAVIGRPPESVLTLLAQ
jgi:arsenate reductase